MKITRYIQNNLTLGLVIPLTLILGFSLMAYFFSTNLITIGKDLNQLNEVILEADELIVLTQSVELDLGNRIEFDTAGEEQFNNSVKILESRLHNLNVLVDSESLKAWMEGNLLNVPSTKPALSKNPLDDLIKLLTDLKSQQEIKLNDRKSEASNLFYRFIFWFVIFIVLGIVFSLLWTYSFRNNLKTKILMDAKLKKAVLEVSELYDNSPCGYFSINNDYMIEKANGTLVRWLGYKTSEVVDRLHISEILALEEGWIAQLINELASRGMVENAEVNALKKDGSLFPAIINVNRRKYDNEVHEDIRFTMFNNSERKEAEVKIKNLNKELEAFSYSVSHDLRAPLRSINGYARILKEDHEAVLTQHGAMPSLEVIIRNSTKMGNLIDDLLNFARLNRTQLNKVNVNMTDLVDTIKDEIINGESEHISFTRSELTNCNCDRNLIQQVWVNLLSNAIKYSSKKVSPVVEVGNMKSGSEVIYYVKDNGAGFDMQYADKLFGVFQRLHKDSEFPGTGVGLALVKRIVERHEGSVWAESELGTGSTFYFSLPMILENANKNEVIN